MSKATDFIKSTDLNESVTSGILSKTLWKQGWEKYWDAEDKMRTKLRYIDQCQTCRT